MSDETPIKTGGPIAWMARNPVAANLVMVVFLAGGFIISRTVKKEVFPEVDLDMIQVSVPYPGASPEEVETGILLAVEEHIRGIDGVKKITALAVEGAGVLNIELELGANDGIALQDIQNAVDGITTFPRDAERPKVKLLTNRTEVMSLAVYADVDAAVLHEAAERIRDAMLQRKEVNLVELSGVRPREIAVEVSQENLRRYGLTLGAVADLIRRSSRDLPGGGIRTAGGEILLRTRERRDWGAEFATVPVVTSVDGTVVYLGDIAKIKDGYTEVEEKSLFNGKPAVLIKVYRTGSQSPVTVSKAVKSVVAELTSGLPPGIKTAIWFDLSEMYQARMNLLLRNAAMGLGLVLLLLGLFLEPRLAFWVTLGIPISFMGAFMLIPMYDDVSINMISLFAFIIALGIVVDDAIVVGENVFDARSRNKSLLDAAIEGTQKVAMPVTFSVLTNIAAFLPMFFVSGVMGKFFRQVPAVVVSVFILSLIESLFILPAHIGHRSKPWFRLALFDWLSVQQQKIRYWLEYTIRAWYAPCLRFTLRNRYVTISFSIAMLVVVVGLLKSGTIKVRHFPEVESDFIMAKAVLPFGAPLDDTLAIEQQLVQSAHRAIDVFGGREANLRGIYGQIGGLDPDNGGHRAQGNLGSHEVSVMVYLLGAEARKVTAREFTKTWRREFGDVGGLDSLVFRSDIGGPSAGSAIDVALSHRDLDVLESAAADLAVALASFEGVHDIDNGFTAGKPQLNFTVLPEGEALNFTAEEIGRQVRHSFYGAEALRQQRGRDEIRVMVRLPRTDRSSELSIEELVLRTPAGGEVLLREVARFERGNAYTSIQRTDGRRVIHVTASVEPQSRASAILNELTGIGGPDGAASRRETSAAMQADSGSPAADDAGGVLPELQATYSGLGYTLEGEAKDFSDSMKSLGRGFMLAMLVVFTLLAVPFKSYIQPMIIMTAIPFGIVGAIIGHVIMGYQLSMMSMFGIVALSGVVVNDTLVLIEFANRSMNAGVPAFDAISAAGARRFRPIILTSLTTFGGLSPMIFETSMQARFLIPMAISLGYGILFATVIALIVVPCFYLIVEDMRAFTRMLRADG